MKLFHRCLRENHPYMAKFAHENPQMTKLVLKLLHGNPRFSIPLGFGLFIVLMIIARLRTNRTSLSHISLINEFSEQKTFRKIKLVDLEKSMFMLEEQGISSITYFQVEENKIEECLKTLECRVVEIVVKNLWLTGRLKSDNREVYLHYCSSNIPKMKEVVKVVEIDSSFCFNDDILDYQALNDVCKKHLITTGTDLINKDLPLFKATFLKFKNGESGEINRNQFALIWSVSHIAGDGATFYELQKMIDKKVEPFHMDPVRFLDSKKIKEKIGDKEYKFMCSYKFATNMVLGVLCTLFQRIFFQYNSIPSPVYYLNDDFIAQEKEKVKISGEVPFVSTNDICMSWFFKQCDADFGIMATNLRSRVEGITRKMAGNYEVFMIYNKEDYQTASLIRKSVTSLKRQGNPEEPIPGFWRCLFDATATATNWCTFFDGEFEIEGSLCKQLFHIPLYNIKELMSSIPCNNMIIFRPNKNQTAILILPKPGFNLTKAEKYGILGTKLPIKIWH